MESLPVYTEDLIKMLEERFPNRHPTLNMTDREIWYKAGQRSVVDLLLSLKEEADKNILKGE